MRKTHFDLHTRRQESNRGGFLPAGTADEYVRRDLHPVFQIHRPFRQGLEIRDMDFDEPVPDQGEQVGFVVEEGNAGPGIERIRRGFQFGGLGMGVVVIGREDVVAEEGPEGIDDEATEAGSMEECADAWEAVRGAPDAGTEPG